LYDASRLIACLLTQLRKPTDDLLTSLAPLLVLRTQPAAFFTRREVVASPLFDLVYRDDDSLRQVRQVRCQLLAQFPVSVVLPRLYETGLFTKFSLCIICYAGGAHGKVPDVCDEFEANFPEMDDDLFIPVCDAFFFADRRRCLDFALSQKGSPRVLALLDSAIKKFTDEDVVAFVRSGQFDRLLRLDFYPEAEAVAVNLLFTFVFRAKTADLDGQWEQLFEIGSHFFDSRKPECRLAAVKLIAALLTTSATQNHLLGNIGRVQHIAEVASEDWGNPDIQKVGKVLRDSMTPGAALEELVKM
jgi:hypothetical protein